MIYVVMGRLQSRRDSISGQLRDLGLDFKEVPAVYLDFLPESARNSKLKLAEVGCVLAHQACYRHMVENDISAAMILEDDAIIDPRVAELDLVQLLSGSDVVLLGLSKLLPEEYRYSSRFFPLKSSENISGILVGQPFKVRDKGTVGYVISNRAVRVLLSVNVSLDFVADAWRKYSETLVIHETRPLLVYEDNASFGSEIEFQRSGTSELCRRMSFRKLISRHFKGAWQMLLIRLMRAFYFNK